MRVMTLLALGASALVLTVGAAPARADFGFKPGSVIASVSTTQAGAHPDLTTSFAFNQKPDGTPDGNVRDVAVSLPPGIVGDATAIPQCTEDQITAFGACPAQAMVGQFNVDVLVGGSVQGGSLPLYNMVPGPEEAARFGANLFLLNVYLSVSVRSDDYGIITVSKDISDATPVVDAGVTLWGVPADHNGAVGVPRRAFLTNPATCGIASHVTFTADSWQSPGQNATETATLPAFTGCDKLPALNPSVSIGPGSTAAGQPSGYDIDLNVPQIDNPDGVATPPVKKVSIALPQGVAISPVAADGLQACTDAQMGFGSSSEPRCPNASKVGTVSIVSPDLGVPLTGSLYVGQPQPGHIFRLFLDAEAQGVMIKLPGTVTADSQTGQLTTTFDDTPPLPFSSLQVHLKGGSRAVLANPSGCGTFTATATMTPYGGGPDGVASSPFDISWDGAGGACPDAMPFAPQLSTGVTQVLAGASNPFVFRVTRDDRDQTLGSIQQVKLPLGLLAATKGVSLCPDSAIAAAAASSGVAEQASPSCPANSQIGTVQVGSGPGSHPLYLPGKVYLTGSYKGAPYGLAEIVPAVAGPYDLGTVVVRAAVFVDPTTAQLTVDSDPLPTILQGIPLQLRDIAMTIDRPGFMRNPTSCNPTQITANVLSTAGTVAALASRFQVGRCQALGFSPHLNMRLTGKGRTRSGDHPTLTATLTQPGGQANIHTAKVALPLSLALDPNNSQHVCDYDTAQAVHGGSVGCPASTIVGQATAQTPLLSQPLSGPVYLVQGIRFGKNGQAIHTLPSLLIPLRGQIALDLRAQSAVSGGKLVTTFSTIPDAPVSKFTLKINGGRKGILVITGRGKTICGKKQVSNATFGAQSGRSMRSQVKMSTPCAAVKHNKKTKAKRGGKNGRTRSAKHAVRGLVAGHRV